MSSKLTGQEIREKFSAYFKKKNHEVIASGSLVPRNDKTLLFSNAGMNQFKDYFTGKTTPINKRAVTIQKCVRAGGKHNDLENVGHTARHHTFFEMLGNFSFGDYFKEDAIRFAWEFLTKELNIPAEKLYVTVHYSDDEAREIWNKKIGLSLERIFTKGDADNFWEMGEFGPCGPCSEIFFDHGEEYTDHELQRKNPQDLLEDEKRYVEIWNLVFMQFEKTPEGRLSLPRPSIDTGAGLERVAAALQACYNNYDTDIFLPLMKKIETLSGKKYDPKLSDEKTKAAFRVVADHIRSATMLITDGVIPSNEGRGYVLRRIIRRAIKYLNELGVHEVSFYKLVPAVFETLGAEYPQNSANSELAIKLLELEEKKFRETLENGLKFLTESLAFEVKNNIFSGRAAFKLYDTFGFPPDLTEMFLHDHGFTLDHAAYEKAMNEQKELSKKSWKGSLDNGNKLFYAIKEKNGATSFVGYEKLTTPARLLDIVEMGEVKGLIFDTTSFYGESGGQVGDTGVIYDGKNIIASIEDTQKPIDDLFVHFSKDSDALEVGKSYILAVNSNSRELIKKNHSATHLLQSALIKILGPHVKQAGSLVTADKLRFDFAHTQAMTKEEIQKVEDIVNAEINCGHNVEANIMDIDSALKKGAMALFGEKYGKDVRVLSMGNFSTELCGGVHVKNTNEIGLITILSESSLATGVRRIEATTGPTAIHHLTHRSLLLKKVETIVMDKEERAIGKIENMFRDLKEKQKEIDFLKTKIQIAESKELFKNITKIGGVDVGILHANPGSDLRQLSDLFIDQYKNSIIILFNLNGEKSTILVRTSEQGPKIDANEILKEILPVINGRGGGKFKMAQGSGEANLIANIAPRAKKILTEKLG